MKVKLVPDLPPRRRISINLTPAARQMAAEQARAKRRSLGQHLDSVIEDECARRQPQPKAQS